MTGARPSAALILLLGVVVVLASALGGVMHESDQAALLSGAHALAFRSTRIAGIGFYQYDKYYLSYWLTAAALRLFPQADPVAAGNILSFSFFWLPALAAVVQTARRNTAAAWLVAVALLAPAILVHSSFLAPVFLSGGFLLLTIGVMRRRGRAAWGALLYFIATAARADALLLFPLLVWLGAPRARLSAMWRAPHTWRFAAAGLGALALGGWCRGGFSAGFYAPLWRPRVLAAYTIFGLGAAVLFLGAAVFRLGAAAVRARSRSVRLFAAAGVIAVVLPFAFYALQMCSIRHWTVGLLGLAALPATPRGRRWLLGGSSLLRRRHARVPLVGAALLPLVVGLRLPFPFAPQGCFTRPTYLPSADGLIPVGALLWNAWERRPGGMAHDHNHRLWMAARSVAHWPRQADGFAPILRTPLGEIVALGAQLDGERPRYVSAAELGAGPWSAELRALLRVGPSSTSPAIEDWRAVVQKYRLERLGGEETPCLIVRGTTGAPSAEQMEWIVLAELFEWREFRVLPPPAKSGEGAGARVIADPLRRGHTLVLWGRAPFVCEWNTAAGNRTLPSRRLDIVPTRETGVAWQACVLRGRDGAEAEIRLRPADASVRVLAAVSALPDYMAGP